MGPILAAAWLRDSGLIGAQPQPFPPSLTELFHAEAAELGSLQQRRCFGLADPNTLIICPFAFASL